MRVTALDYHSLFIISTRVAASDAIHSTATATVLLLLLYCTTVLHYNYCYYYYI